MTVEWALEKDFVKSQKDGGPERANEILMRCGAINPFVYYGGGPEHANDVLSGHSVPQKSTHAFSENSNGIVQMNTEESVFRKINAFHEQKNAEKNAEIRRKEEERRSAKKGKEEEEKARIWQEKKARRTQRAKEIIDALGAKIKTMNDYAVLRKDKFQRLYEKECGITEKFFSYELNHEEQTALLKKLFRAPFFGGSFSTVVFRAHLKDMFNFYKKYGVTEDEFVDTKRFRGLLGTVEKNIRDEFFKKVEAENVKEEFFEEKARQAERDRDIGERHDRRRRGRGHPFVD